VNGASQEVAVGRQRRIEAKGPQIRALFDRLARDTRIRAARVMFFDVVDDGVDGKAGSDFPGIVTAHPVGDHTETEILANREAVLVGRPNAAFVSESVSA
jgi:hypothetical protein